MRLFAFYTRMMISHAPDSFPSFAFILLASPCLLAPA